MLSPFNRIRGVSLYAFFSLTSAAALCAQSRPATAEPDEPVTMSPFVLSEKQDVGYRSTTSLAGSRLNTDYKDIASSLEVMTPDFLNDIGAFTVEQAFNYSGNTESPAETWAVGAGTGDMFLGTATAGVVPSRTRGLGRTTATRNYFPTLLPYDAYNSSDHGLTIASGPNPALFALGSAAGVTNTDYNRARLRRTTLSTRAVFDSFGSVRGDVDFNQPILPGTLALRVETLFSDRKYAFKGNYAKDKRLSAALGWSPRKTITIDAYAEHVERKTSVPFYSLPTDAVTPWINPGIGNRAPFTTPDQSPDAPNRGNVPGNNTYLYNWAGGAVDAPTYTFGVGAPAGLYSYRYSAQVSTLGRYANQVLGLTANTFIPTLQDETVYPFKKYGLWGSSRPSIFRGDNLTAIANVKLAPDLYLEVAGSYERMLEKNATLYSPGDIMLRIDPNRFGYQAGYTPLDPITAGPAQAANRAANAARRTTNPNFGALYIDGAEAAITKDHTERQGRVSLAYEVAPARKWSLGNWADALFSRQRGLATLSVRDSTHVSQRFGRLVLDNVDSGTGLATAPAVITAANAKAGTARYMAATNRVFRTRQYLNPDDASQATGQLPFDAFTTWSFPDDGAGKPFQVGLLPTEVATGSRAYSQSAAFVYQGGFLRDRVVVTLTRSYDQLRTKQLDPLANVTFANTGLGPAYRQVPWTRYQRAPTFVNTSRAVVWHVKDWVSLLYNETSNVDPTPPASHDIDGSLNPFSKGENKEYGVRFRYKGVGLTVNRYETRQTDLDVPNVFGQTPFLLPLARLEGRLIEVQRARTQALGVAEFNDYYAKSGANPGFNPLDTGIGSMFYRLYGDNRAHGTEIELSGRVGALDFRFTAGKNDSVKSKIGPRFVAYGTSDELLKRMQSLEWYAYDGTSGQYRPVVGVTAGNAPIFGAPGAQPLKGWDNIRYTDTPTNLTMAAYYYQTVLPGALLVQKLNGSSNLLVREWRYNGTVAYTLGKAWRFGVSIRQRARAIIGYLNDTTTVQSGGQTVSSLVWDLNHPIYSPEQWYFDPFVTYRGKLKNGYTYAIQLNVYNATKVNATDVIGIYASTASKLDVNDPRFAYYGWNDPLNLPLTVRVQDPISAQLTLRFGF